MIKLDRFLEAIEEIASEKPTYREGGSGNDGTCDCVGLIMGAMLRCGAGKWPMHSSNYAARCEMETLTELTAPQCCFRGMVVYKARNDISRLNERYQRGGRYYNGDLLDYYHVGVVVSSKPLIICHCTSGGGVNGITFDTKLGEWKHGGILKGVDYSHTEALNMNMIVTANSGSTVNLRRKPSSGAEVLAKVSVGQHVLVTEQAGSWSTVEWQGLHGYMMSEYLTAVREDETEVREDEPKLMEVLKEICESLHRIEAMLEVPEEGEADDYL